jgi:hypothetical protein
MTYTQHVAVMDNVWGTPLSVYICNVSTCSQSVACRQHVDIYVHVISWEVRSEIGNKLLNNLF